MQVRYRSFRNTDPPALVRVWNESLTGRSGAFLPSTNPLETFVLAKPYFDPKGLIVAEEDNQPVGFVHAGFGPDPTGRALTPSTGVICMLMVRPGYRGGGIGSELLKRAEDYLLGQGATRILFGAMRPLDPFYLGMYGGCDVAGILTSDSTVEPFLLRHGYVLHSTCLILDRDLGSRPPITDVRFVALRRKYEMRAAQRPAGRKWFDECQFSPLEMLQFELVDKGTGATVARALTWEMDLFAWRAHQAAIGILELEVEPSLRRQGLAKYLLSQMLQDLQDQCFAHVEIQVRQDNTSALNLFKSLGFRQVDEGRVYRKS